MPHLIPIPPGYHNTICWRSTRKSCCSSFFLRRQFRAVLDHQSGQLTQISSPEIPVPRLGREQRTETFSRHILQTPCPNNNQLHQQVSYYEIKHLTLHICSSKLVYRFLMPLMQDLFGCDHQGLYEIPDSYIIPFLATPSQGGGRW